MTEGFTRELHGIAEHLKQQAAQADRPKVSEPLRELVRVVDEVGKSWSGSNIGHHSRVCCANFEVPRQVRTSTAARYKVTDAGGSPIGELGKQFKASLLRSTWRVFSAGGDELMWARERSVAVALFRRVKGLVELVPVIGWEIGWVLELLPIPYHFDLFAGEQRIGAHERIWGQRDRYRLNLSGDVERTIDRRLALALAVGMDALQAH